MPATTDYPAGFETPTTSDDTRRAYAALMAKAALRPRVSEATMDRYRVRWQLCQLVDAGVVRHWGREYGRTLVDARGFMGPRSYATTRELEAFVHGALAALDQ